ncbi:hypothetical protein [Nonomuraea sp. NPDC003214]
MPQPTAYEIFAGIVQAAEAFVEQQHKEREEFLASPEQVAQRAATKERRSAGARRGWEKRRAAAQARQAEERRLDDIAEREIAARQGGPACEAWDSPGPPYPDEIPCSLPAGHGPSHENVTYGLTWDEDQ